MGYNGEFRFNVGTEVLCRTGEAGSRNEWSRGSIIALRYREPDWPPGRIAPYQVELRDGTRIFVPADVPELCRKFDAPLWSRAVSEEDMKRLQAAVAAKGCEESDNTGRGPLLSCVEKGWQEGALFLLGQHADPCKAAGPERVTALHLAALPLSLVAFENSDKDDIVFLREDGAVSAKLLRRSSPDDSIDYGSITSTVYDEKAGRLSWTSVSEEGRSLSAKTVVTKKARVWAPLRLAALLEGTTVRVEGLPKPENTKALVTALLRARADVNAQDEDPDNDLDNYTSTTYKDIEQRPHRTALHYAAESGNLGLLAQLITAKANVTVQDRFKMTPLDAAVEGGSNFAVDLLLRNRADPNQGNMRRGLHQSCLHYVSDLGNVDFAKLMLKHGGQVNLTGKQDMTPLHLAARKKHIEVVEVLLNARADVTLTDKLGKTASQYAVSNGSAEVGKALALDLQLAERIEILQTAKAAKEERQKLIKLLEAD